MAGQVMVMWYSDPEMSLVGCHIPQDATITTLTSMVIPVLYTEYTLFTLKV